MTERTQDGDIALGTCPACSGPVSSEAASCLACGHPLKVPLKSSHGTAILILGTMGLVWLLPAPIAWIWGHIEIKEIGAGIRDPDGEGMVRTGRVLGIIGTVVFFLVVVYALGNN